jgi:hypothetical protein
MGGECPMDHAAAAAPFLRRDPHRRDVLALVPVPFLVYPQKMKQFADFEHLLLLDQEVLDEIVREGELRLSSQFETATAADQRALTLIGFQTAAATAAIGASVALLLGKEPHYYFLCVGFFITCGLLVAAFKAMDSVRPKLFGFPGNYPANWFPSEWASFATAPHDLSMKRARVEQCCGLDDRIRKNLEILETNAKSVKFSIDISFWSVAMTFILVLGYVIWVVIAPN